MVAKIRFPKICRKIISVFRIGSKKFKKNRHQKNYFLKKNFDHFFVKIKILKQHFLFHSIFQSSMQHKLKNKRKKKKEK